MKRPILSQEKIDTYHRDGFPVRGLRLTGEKLARLQQLSDELVERNAEFGDTPMVCPHVPGGGVQGLRGDKAWFDYSADPDIHDMVEQLIGEDIILWGTNLFHKPPVKNTDRGGRRIPFHRDGRYWPIEPLKTLSVWLAIEGSTAKNGCLQIILNSHRGGQVGEQFTSTDPDDAIPETLRESEFDAGDAVRIELEGVQMVLFDVFTIHGSDANASVQRRLGSAIRYMPSTSWFNHDGAQRAGLPSNAHNTWPLFPDAGGRCLRP